MTDRTNWAGNITFKAERFHTPGSVAELQRIVAGAQRVRALGTGHSFNAIADTSGDQVTVAGLPADIDIDLDRSIVTVGGGVRFGELAPVLDLVGQALHNLGSLPHISIAGACATGTHGSGISNGNLASAVVGLELINADGDLLSLSGPELPGAVVALGSLGIVTRVSLATVPSFEIEQYVYDDLPWPALLESLDEILGAAYSVSVFTDFTGAGNQIWVKRRVDSGVVTPQTWLGARLADGPRHPVPGVDPQHCTQQLGVPGPWHERLPHFRLDFKPSNGDELQTEYLVPSDMGVAAVRALYEIREQIAPVLQISEIRAIAADELWLSPSYQQNSTALHFTWLPDTAAVLPVLAAIEGQLAPFGARPHWGKVFTTSPETVRSLYPKYADFEDLRKSLDPTGKFSNELMGKYFHAQ